MLFQSIKVVPKTWKSGSCSRKLITSEWVIIFIQSQGLKLKMKITEGISNRALQIAESCNPRLEKIWRTCRTWRTAKHQPDELKHSFYDSKHYIHDSKYSICQEGGSKQYLLYGIYGVSWAWENMILSQLRMKEHQAKCGALHLFINLNMRDLKWGRFNPVSKLET